MSVDFNGNAWYQLTETRVDFNSSFQSVNGNVMFFGPAATDAKQYWQLQALGGGEYQIRNKDYPKKQLSTCFDKDEADDSRTIPCLRPSTGENAQKWRITQWPDGNYKLTNVANGTGYNLDVHPGNPPFMSSQTSGSPRQPGQHWQFSSLRKIDDGAYSTTYTNIPSSTSSASSASRTPASASASATSTSSSSATSSPSSSHLSVGASAGIGVGTALAVIALVVLGFFLIRRRRKRRAGKYEAVELGVDQPAQTAGELPSDKYSGGGAAKMQEVWTPPAELPGENRPHEMGTGTGLGQGAYR